jgi:uncharacterized protein (DUF2141 family)|tara:strand:- start:320 stop:727 length:408 start_codon:yes stop_codon:yes gene_type:complete
VRTLILLFIVVFSPSLFSHGTIIITNVEHGDGYIDVKIYDSKESFLKEDLARETVRKKATKGKTVVPLSKIHEGKIAIVVYHDEDSDGKLKTGLFWRPKEGYAFSNGYKPKSPPKFSKASIKLIHGKLVKIELNY